MSNRDHNIKVLPYITRIACSSLYKSWQMALPVLTSLFINLCEVHKSRLNFAEAIFCFFAFLQTKQDSLSTNQRQPYKKYEYPAFYSDRAAQIAPLLWKIILNGIKRQSLIFPMFLPLSLQLLIRCLNLLQNNSAGKEIKGCWIKYEAKAVNCSNAYHFIQM